jgi:pimeloyl-ACP methyl ester carboxylesterase
MGRRIKLGTGHSQTAERGIECRGRTDPPDVAERRCRSATTDNHPYARSRDCGWSRLCRCCGRNERVKALVYIAALAPDEGETVAEVFYRDESHPKAPKLAPDADGFIWMPDESFAEAFAQDATPAQIALCRAVQRPISVKSIQEPVAAPAWKTKPVWYLLAEEDRMINPKTQRFMAERMSATIRSFPVDHTPLLTAPDKAADIILEAVKATLA